MSISDINKELDDIENLSEEQISQQILHQSLLFDAYLRRAATLGLEIASTVTVRQGQQMLCTGHQGIAVKRIRKTITYYDTTNDNKSS